MTVNIFAGSKYFIRIEDKKVYISLQNEAKVSLRFSGFETEEISLLEEGRRNAANKSCMSKFALLSIASLMIRGNFIKNS